LIRAVAAVRKPTIVVNISVVPLHELANRLCPAISGIFPECLAATARDVLLAITIRRQTDLHFSKTTGQLPMICRTKPAANDDKPARPG